MKDNKILQPGRNCYRVDKAEKVSFLVDGANYFKALYDSLPLAEQRIMILAWDIYSQLKLVPPGEEKNGLSSTLCTLLDQLARKNRDLNINILSWDFTLLFALSREMMPIYKLDWNTHRRMKFCLDDQYPLGSSHHQKIVVIDDALAFSGGLDLTRGRWDTSEHRADNPHREAIDGTELPIRPYHDIQMVVSGPIAATIGDLARERWRRGTGKELPKPPGRVAERWPPGLKVDIENVQVAIARTVPAYDDYEEIREVEQLYLDSIAAAQNYIYIENQFFTTPTICDALAERLGEADGPEIVLNLPLETEGWLSQQSMDMMRVKYIGKLREADKYDHFMVYYPKLPDDAPMSINLHAKLMIMDDRLVRVGSANLNNRSMGLDTECDLIIEADESDERVTQAIRQFRNRLLAEHLGCDIEKVAAEMDKQGTLIHSITALQGDGRTLAQLEPQLPKPDDGTLQFVKITDPERPVDSETLFNHFIPEIKDKPTGRRISILVVSFLVLLAAGLTWRFTPLGDMLNVSALLDMLHQWRDSGFMPVVFIAAFIIGGLIVVPVTLMIIIAVLAFGPLLGFAYALIASFLSALSGYGVGSMLGRQAVRQLAGKRLNQVSKKLAKRGVLTMMVVRVVPVAPFTVVNLIAGASHIKLRDFMMGTLLGMTPGILGITLLTNRVEATLRSPDWKTIATLVVVALVVFSGGYLLSKRLLSNEDTKSEGATSQ